MKVEALEKVTGVAAAAAQLGTELGRVKGVVAERIEEGIDAAKRTVKQGRRRAEHLVDDAEYQIRRRPLNSLGAAFGVGLGLGALIGVLLTRNRHCDK